MVAVWAAIRCRHRRLLAFLPMARDTGRVPRLHDAGESTSFGRCDTSASLLNGLLMARWGSRARDVFGLQLVGP